MDGLIKRTTVFRNKRANRRRTRSQCITRTNGTQTNRFTERRSEFKRRRDAIDIPCLNRARRRLIAFHDRIEFNPTATIIDELDIRTLADEPLHVECLDAPGIRARITRRVRRIRRRQLTTHAFEQQPVAIIKPIVVDDRANPRFTTTHAKMEESFRQRKRRRTRASNQLRVKPRAVDRAALSQRKRALVVERKQCSRRIKRMTRTRPRATTVGRIINACDDRCIERTQLRRNTKRD